MKFAVNKNINYVEPSEDTKTARPDETSHGVGETLPPPIIPKTDKTTLSLPKTPNEIVYLLGSAVTLGFIAAPYII